jgi:hypothetical protein
LCLLTEEVARALVSWSWERRMGELRYSKEKGERHWEGASPTASHSNGIHTVHVFFHLARKDEGA